MPQGGSMKNWICIRLTENYLWTADLFDGHDLIKNIGGATDKISQIICDARKSWGNNLVVRLYPKGYPANINYKGEI